MKNAMASGLSRRGDPADLPPVGGPRSMRRVSSGDRPARRGVAQKGFILGVLGLGMVIGAVATGLLAAQSLPTHRDLLRVEFAVHHEFLAARAAREGRVMDELGHRRVVVAARRDDGWWAAEHMPLVRRVAFPVAAPVLEGIRASEDPSGDGQRAIEGLAWARLAESMENLGFDEEAREAWSRAAPLVGQDEDSLRAALSTTRNFESSEIHAAAERAILER